VGHFRGQGRGRGSSDRCRRAGYYGGHHAQISYLPLANIVKVYGEKMQPDFESVIERKIHTWVNYIEGVMHTGQRNLVRIRDRQ
jgi:hypothetical protein